MLLPQAHVSVTKLCLYSNTCLHWTNRLARARVALLVAAYRPLKMLHLAKGRTRISSGQNIIAMKAARHALKVFEPLQIQLAL